MRIIPLKTMLKRKIAKEFMMSPQKIIESRNIFIPKMVE